MRLIAVLIVIVGWISPSSGYAFDATVAVETGYAAYNRGDFATALRLLSSAAAHGNSDALIGLNYMHVRGDGVPRNAVVAAEYARRAAALGNPEGAMALGYKYQHGVGVSKDLELAVRLHCRAIEFGNPRAMNNLAIMHYEGTYVTPSIAEARSLWRQSAERGHVNGAANLGLSYLNGGSSDLAEARAWLRRAADANHRVARDALAKLGDSVGPPPPFDGADRLVIYPKGMPPGVARECGVALIS